MLILLLERFRHPLKQIEWLVWCVREEIVKINKSLLVQRHAKKRDDDEKYFHLRQ